MLKIVVTAVALVASGPAFAANCPSAFGMASSADSDAFKADPFTILSSNPTGGGALARATRELVLADTAMADAIMALGTAANSDQRSAMGAGLGQAAQACMKSQPDAAARIQGMALGSDGELASAFRTVTGDIATFAVASTASAAPAPAAISGTDAGPLSGGEEASVAQTGAPQASLSGVSAAAARSSSARSSGAGAPPTATVPGPAMGEGLFALLLTAAAAGFVYRRRRFAAAQA